LRSPGIVLKVRQRRFSTLDLFLAVCVVVHIAVAWVNQNWWAGGSYGPRFFADLLPYFMYSLIPVIAWGSNEITVVVK
jgi:hypothetical protein